MYMREDGDGNIEIAIGTLDEPNDIPALTHQSGVESRVRWFELMAGLPEKTTADYRTATDLLRLKSLQYPDTI
jgi:hypothetical protein